ncbi:MAG: acetate kinase, partial [Acutalibacteraceae bacterium]
IHRKNICKNLEFIGVYIDDRLNKSAIFGEETKISSMDSKIEVWVIPTNEEMEIAQETMNLLF